MSCAEKARKARFKRRNQEKRAERLKIQAKHFKEKAEGERRQMENGKVAVLFFGLTFRQKEAQNFWVSLPLKLPTDEIRKRIGKGFGDLGKN